MSFEPEKFFVGIIDFFSILLPGAVLTYLFKNAVGPQLLGPEFGHLQSTEGWVLFLFSSYVLGHFLFFVGSWLDDLAYDPLRKMTDKEQITRLLAGRGLSPRILRRVAWLCFKKDADAALDQVVLIKKKYLNRIGASRAVNAFQWCKATLTGEHREALATVNRFEADSKFFRSFVPVLLVVLGRSLRHHQLWFATASVVAVCLAFVRYMEQRFKSTQQAYWHILTLEAAKVPPPSSTKQSSPHGENDILPTHAGGVVFRDRRSQRQYLLVQAAGDAKEWVLPKGHIELGEDPLRCAIREVKEETGVWARIERELKISKYALADKPVRVQFYLMEAIEESSQEDRWRKHKWLPLDEALKLTQKYDQIQELLALAEDWDERHSSE
jgi:8-oxo-dGTP pyrophosphatase MutT (NUDIX family)